MNSIPRVLFAVIFMVVSAMAADQVKVAGGILGGTVSSDPSVRLFKGVPFAAPPVGDLRWKEPQPVPSWSGVRKADEYGSKCMQAPVFSDMIWREKGMSEDCLYLNIWTPAKSPQDRLPVYVWFHGGGFAAGSGSEPRYDGEYFAKQGIVVVNANYRLGVFGFLALPELTAESPHKASGDYGMLDQVAALKWVKENIAAFGGDPRKVTIGGESAGSFSVSALMASPLAQGLFRGVIGESGAFFGGPSATLAEKPLAEAEQMGLKLAASAGAASLAQLRAKQAEELLKLTSQGPGAGFSPIIDGYFLPASVSSIFAQGSQSRVPLLAGWNSSEMGMIVNMAKEKPTGKTFPDQLRQELKQNADRALKLYPAVTDEQAMQSAADFASDRFIVYCTWKWIEMQVSTGKMPAYRYRFDRVLPSPGVKSFGAAHASGIEYAFNTLDSKKANWQPEDRKTAQTMAAYFANFIKKGTPNGSGLAFWPEFSRDHQVMYINAESKAGPEQLRERYQFLDEVNR